MTLHKIFILFALVLMPAMVFAQVIYPNRGGTGNSTAPSADDLLVGNGSTFDLKTLTAGDNITIDTTGSAVTITATVANETITLSGDISGSGSTAITTAIVADSIINADLNIDVEAVDGDFLQYDSTGDNFTWRSASEVRSDLSLVVGTNVQAYNANLASIAGLTPASSLIIGNGLGGFEMVTPANFITNNNILDTADIGSSVQGYNANTTILGSTIETGEITDDTITHADIADSDQASTMCIYIEDPTANDDLQSIWANKTANDFLLTEMWAESDQTVALDLQVDDGTPADVNGTDITPAAGEAEDTTLSGDTTVAAGEELDLAITSVASTPTWVSICWTGNWVD